MNHPLLAWLEKRLEVKERQGRNGTIRFDSLVEVGDSNGDLALVEAHREILAIHSLEHSYTREDVTSGSGPSRAVCGMCEDGRQSPLAWPCPTVRALASAYRYAPGWDEAWGPT